MLLRGLGPGSPHAPVALRTLVGCALAGCAAVALGVDRPYWAVVTAASVLQINVVLSRHRTLQRTLGKPARRPGLRRRLPTGQDRARRPGAVPDVLQLRGRSPDHP
ncbi:FUSC family protein [Streptomyces peucetius]|uniref:FUSC family protein n=1 Tax=Streptomyces peucetius TaxID=1950 RepID=UPI0039B0A4D9